MLFFLTSLSRMGFQVRYLALSLLFSVIGGFRLFQMGNLHKNIQLLLEFIKGPFLVLHFSFYILMAFLMILTAILLSMLMILLSTLNKCDQSSDQWQQLELASELESDLQDTMDWGRKWLVDFSAGKTQLVSFDWSNSTDVIDVKMDESVLQDKSSFLKMFGLTFSSELDWGYDIISIAKTASKKIGPFIHSMRFLSSEDALYLYKSTIRPCMKYSHVWAGAPSRYLELLYKLQKRICRMVGLSLATSLEPLAHCRIVAS